MTAIAWAIIVVWIMQAYPIPAPLPTTIAVLLVIGIAAIGVLTLKELFA